MMPLSDQIWPSKQYIDEFEGHGMIETEALIFCQIKQATILMVFFLNSKIIDENSDSFTFQPIQTALCKSSDDSSTYE